MKKPDIPADGENRISLQVEEGYAAEERLDVLITNRLPKISRNRVQSLIKEGRVLVDGRSLKASTVVPGGVSIEITFPHPPRPPAGPEDIPLDVLHEDDHVLVINKPAGMVVHPAAGHSGGTLVNALLGRFQNLPNPGGPTHRPGIVHRLDKDTSGVMVIALTDDAMTSLGKAFHDHSIEREYVALVWGDLKDDLGTVNEPLGRHPGDRKRYAVVPETGKRAVTHWKVRERFGLATLIALRLETGRTHQIRVHMAHLGHPVLGDDTYRGRLHGLAGLTSHQRATGRKLLEMLPRQALHARLLGFDHPGSGDRVRFSTPLPDDMAAVVDELRSISG